MFLKFNVFFFTLTFKNVWISATFYKIYQTINYRNTNIFYRQSQVVGHINKTKQLTGVIHVYLQRRECESIPEPMGRKSVYNHLIEERGFTVTSVSKSARLQPLSSHRWFLRWKCFQPCRLSKRRIRAAVASVCILILGLL